VPIKAADTNHVLDEINELRLQVSKMDLERRQLKSKTNRMKQIIHDRNSLIKKALTVTDDRQPNIKTASDSTLEQLRGNIASLQNTLEARQAELDKVRENDKLALSDELQVEVLEYYLEFDRLTQQLAVVREGEAIIGNEIAILNRQIEDSHGYDKKINDFQVQIDQLADKLVAYRQAEGRIAGHLALEKLAAGKTTVAREKADLEREIQRIAEEKKRLEEEITVVRENDQKNREYLQSIIDEQTGKIAEAIEAQKQQMIQQSSPSRRSSKK
jgi:predicted  nucleic acid-binding Zn-ribbon protein